jgi:threonine/homoserine efflux transporter RhtA
MNLFVTTFFPEGLQQLAGWLHTGHVSRADILIAVPAWFSNLLLLVGGLWAYSRLPERSFADLWKFAAAFAATTGFLALDMAVFQPRYLRIFPMLLHPHLPSLVTR